MLELLGWVARGRAGAQRRGPCPMHGSESATSRVLSAHLGRGVWHGLRCGASGNALGLWARVTPRGLYEAVLELSRRLGRAMPWLESPRERIKELGTIHDEQAGRVGELVVRTEAARDERRARRRRSGTARIPGCRAASLLPTSWL